MEKKRGLIEMLVLSGETAILRRSPMTLEQHQDVERLMILLTLISTQSHGIIITRSAWCAQQTGSQKTPATRSRRQIVGVEQPVSGGGWEYRSALRRGKLEMWNNDFYWAVGKQIHNSLEPGTHASPASPPGNPLLRGCSASVDEECDGKEDTSERSFLDGLSHEKSWKYKF